MKDDNTQAGGFIYLPVNDNGQAYLEDKDVVFHEDDFRLNLFSRAEIELATPLVDSINDELGTHVELYEDETLDPAQVAKAAEIVARFKDRQDDGAFQAVRKRFLGILEEAAAMRRSLWMDI